MKLVLNDRSDVVARPIRKQDLHTLLKNSMPQILLLSCWYMWSGSVTDPCVVITIIGRCVDVCNSPNTSSNYNSTTYLEWSQIDLSQYNHCPIDTYIKSIILYCLSVVVIYNFVYSLASTAVDIYRLRQRKRPV